MVAGPRLFADLELAHGDGRFPRLFRSLTKADLLILDDWGPDRLTANQRGQIKLIDGQGRKLGEGIVEVRILD